MSKVHQDSHPGVVTVEFKEGEFASRLIAARVQTTSSSTSLTMQDFKEGDLISKIEGTRLADKAYSSVQFGPNKHFEVRRAISPTLMCGSLTLTSST